MRRGLCSLPNSISEPPGNQDVDGKVATRQKFGASAALAAHRLDDGRSSVDIEACSVSKPCPQSRTTCLAASFQRSRRPVLGVAVDDADLQAAKPSYFLNAARLLMDSVGCPHRLSGLRAWLKLACARAPSSRRPRLVHMIPQGATYLNTRS